MGVGRPAVGVDGGGIRRAVPAPAGPGPIGPGSVLGGPVSAGRVGLSADVVRPAGNLVGTPVDRSAGTLAEGRAGQRVLLSAGSGAEAPSARLAGRRGRPHRLAAGPGILIALTLSHRSWLSRSRLSRDWLSRDWLSRHCLRCDWLSRNWLSRPCGR